MATGRSCQPVASEAPSIETAPISGLPEGQMQGTPTAAAEKDPILQVGGPAGTPCSTIGPAGSGATRRPKSAGFYTQKRRPVHRRSPARSSGPRTGPEFRNPVLTRRRRGDAKQSVLRQRHSIRDLAGSSRVPCWRLHACLRCAPSERNARRNGSARCDRRIRIGPLEHRIDSCQHIGRGAKTCNAMHHALRRPSSVSQRSS